MVDGLDAPRGERIALAVLEADGTLGVQPTGRGRSVLTYRYRPTWALIACICTVWIAGLGLLFLLVKRENSGDLTVSEGPRGAVVTVPPVVSDELRAALEAQLRTGQVPVADRSAGSQPAAPPLGAPAPPAAIPGSGQAPAPTPAGSRSVRGDRSNSGLDDGTVARTDAASEAPAPQQPAPPPPAPTAPDAPPAPTAPPPPPAPAPAAAPATPTAPRLEIRFPAGTLHVDEGETVILGRNPSDRPGARGVAVPGDASTLSKSHAKVRFTGGTVEIQDLNSKNGTQVGDNAGSLPAGTATTVAVPATITLGAVACVVTTATDQGSADRGWVQ